MLIDLCFRINPVGCVSTVIQQISKGTNFTLVQNAMPIEGIMQFRKGPRVLVSHFEMSNKSADLKLTMHFQPETTMS